jgi:methionine-S-sulfoxide reductase
MIKTIYFAGGCFWGTEHYLRQFDGVLETVAGYANGNIPDPSYEEVYTDTTGYVECVKVTYDPEIITLQALSRLFFRSIDPHMINRQGNDIGTRYRTGIYWSDKEDKADIEMIFNEMQNRYPLPIVVEKKPLECFYPAEDYHQDYLIRNPEGYCHLSPTIIKAARRYTETLRSLRAYSDEEKKEILPRFFKTGKGQYGEGDRFMGVTVPNTRKVAKSAAGLSSDVVEMLLESPWHESRLCALLILIEKYRKDPETIVTFYLNHTRWVNNWDLVDLSAPYILGDYLVKREDRSILYELAQSPVMWEQRISVVSTLMLIRNGQFEDTMRLAQKLLSASHDLMQKAVGWMLREVGKRDKGLLQSFLEKHKSQMPRTMLRYAIEKFSPEERAYYMKRS